MMGENRPAALLVYAMGITQHARPASPTSCLRQLADAAHGNMGVPGTGVNPLRARTTSRAPVTWAGAAQRHADQTSPRQRLGRSSRAAWGVDRFPDKGRPDGDGDAGRGPRGDVRCLYIIGETPWSATPICARVAFAGPHRIHRGAGAVLRETCHFADVILPAAAFGRKSGHLHQHRKRHPAGSPPWSRRARQRDSWIVSNQPAGCWHWARRRLTPDAVGRLGSTTRPEDAMDEINATPITRRRDLSTAGGRRALQWPVPDKTHPGTPILHTKQFSCGKGAVLLPWITFRRPSSRTTSTPSS